MTRRNWESFRLHLTCTAWSKSYATNWKSNDIWFKTDQSNPKQIYVSLVTANSSAQIWNNLNILGCCRYAVPPTEFRGSGTMEFRGALLQKNCTNLLNGSQGKMARTLVRMEENSPCKKITFSQHEGSREKGRPKLRWLDSVLKMSSYWK
jgi:hypothetical protein